MVNLYPVILKKKNKKTTTNVEEVSFYHVEKFVYNWNHQVKNVLRILSAKLDFISDWWWTLKKDTLCSYKYKWSILVLITEGCQFLFWTYSSNKSSLQKPKIMWDFKEVLMFVSLFFEFHHFAKNDIEWCNFDCNWLIFPCKVS